MDQPPSETSRSKPSPGWGNFPCRRVTNKSSSPFPYFNGNNMAPKHRLELHTNQTFQSSEWRVQRIGWVLWAGILVAGLLGLVGAGPLSNVDSSAPDDSLTVAYQRFVHYHQPTLLDLTVRPGPSTDQTLRVKLSESLLDSLEIQRIEPEPNAREIAVDGIVYTFQRELAADSAKIAFHIEYERFGRSRARIELIGHGSVQFDQFVYP
jgi:hypothetical protein